MSAYTWNDDDRAFEPLPRSLRGGENSQEDSDVTPLHIILRDAYWEQRDALYKQHSFDIQQVNKPSRTRTRRLSNVDYQLESESDLTSEASMDNDDCVESPARTDDTEQQDEGTDKHMNNIIENQIYRRFGYV